VCGGEIGGVSSTEVKQGVKHGGVVVYQLKQEEKKKQKN